MIRLHVTVEGATKQRFLKDVLCPQTRLRCSDKGATVSRKSGMLPAHYGCGASDSTA